MSTPKQVKHQHEREVKMKALRKGSKVLSCGVVFLLLTASQSFGGPPTRASKGVTRGISKDVARGASSSSMKAMKGARLSALPKLSVTSFKKAVASSGMMAAAGLPGGSSSTRSPAIDLGDEIELYWSLSYDNVLTPQVAINGRRVTGETHVASDGTPWMAGRSTFRPADTTAYTLTATAVPEGGGTRSVRTEKTLRVTVKKPVLTVLEPEVDQDDLTVRFSASNTGNADFRSTRINVTYWINGGSSLMEGSFRTDPMEIRQGRRVELGEITLPDRARAMSTDSIRIRVDVGASYVLPLRSARRDFTHRWTTQTVTINNSVLRLLGMGTVCEIMIDNWNESHGSGRAITPPHQANASFVDLDILGEHQRMEFTLPHLESVATGGPLGLKYWTYLRNIHAHSRGDADLFSIVDGKLQISLEFPNTDSREIKIGRIGNVGGYDGKWIDDDAPDVNISRFTVNITFTPAVRGGELTYTGVDVEVSGLSASFPGGWSWLNPGFQDYITRVVRRNLDSALTTTLSDSSIRTAIMGGINSGMSVASADITRIISVRGSGSSITLTYL